METVHAYTNDQNLIDNYHKKNRRGRGAPLNMVITETGASSAVVKLLPELARQTDGQRHSRADAERLAGDPESDPRYREVTTEGKSREFLRNVSLHSDLQRQIDFTTSPDIVSSDLVGNRHACIVDGEATIVNGKPGGAVCLVRQ